MSWPQPPNAVFADPRHDSLPKPQHLKRKLECTDSIYESLRGPPCPSGHLESAEPRRDWMDGHDQCSGNQSQSQEHSLTRSSKRVFVSKALYDASGTLVGNWILASCGNITNLQEYLDPETLGELHRCDSKRLDFEDACYDLRAIARRDSATFEPNAEILFAIERIHLPRPRDSLSPGQIADILYLRKSIDLQQPWR